MRSVWENTERPVFLALDGDITTDVLIIGGGMAGLLCALLLDRAGIRYTLAEADRICGGVTAGTTAKITLQHGFFADRLIRRVDAAFADDDPRRFMVLRVRKLLLYGRKISLGGSGPHDGPVLRQFREDVPDLPRRLAFAVEHLRESRPDPPVIVQIGEVHFLIRQFLQLFVGVLLGDRAFFHISQKLSDVIFSHVVCISLSICRDSFRICCMRMFRSSMRRATV